MKIIEFLILSELKRIYNISIILFSGLIYAAAYIPPDKFWPAGFFSYGIPAVLGVNTILFIARIRYLKWDALFPFVMLVFGIGFIRDTFSYNTSKSNKGIKVVSYNVKVFDIYNDDGNETNAVENILKWIKEQDADIICLQEFYNYPHSSIFNTLERISHQNQYKYHYIPLLKNKMGAEFGPVIFSRYPIINSGAIKFKKNQQNNVIYSDLLVNEDTIRIYNMHLQSLHIDEKKIINSNDIQSEVENLSTSLKLGFIQRAEQVRILNKHISLTEYPLILCGDLNDIPYSYAYRKINENLHNAFIQGGKGFGFTYNGILFFLRIDHQFFSKHLIVNECKTHRNIKYSDHFPVSANYSLRK